MSMCNNDVTYADKWDTVTNNAALKKLDNKFFDRSICSPHCPVGWAPEVLELLERLDKEFGIARNCSTIRAYSVDLPLYKYFFVTTYKNAKYNLLQKENFKGVKFSLKQRVLKAKASLIKDIKYALKVFNVRYTNPILNKILKPKITLSQVKEKFGYLTLYINCEPEYKEYIDNLIYETTIKLATKGAYYPLEQIKRKDNERDVLQT